MAGRLFASHLGYLFRFNHGGQVYYCRPKEFFAGATVTYSLTTPLLYVKGSSTGPMPLVLELYTKLLLKTLITSRSPRFFTATFVGYS